MMDHMTEVSGLSWPRRILNTLQNDDRLLAGGAAFLGGLMTAMGRITGEVAPFGVAYAAAAPRRMTVPALLGVALGYLLMAAPPAAWQYPLAALLAVGLRPAPGPAQAQIYPQTTKQQPAGIFWGYASPW